MVHAMLKLAYLSSPYTHADQNIISLRYEEALRATIWGWKQGYLVFSPVVYTHQIAVLTPEVDQHWRWLEFDLRILDICDELWVLMLDGWKESQGVAREMKEAKRRGILIKYIDPADIAEKRLPLSVIHQKLETWGKRCEGLESRSSDVKTQGPAKDHS